MGRRICLTEDQRRAEDARQMRLRLADSLALYKHRRGVKQEDLALELGISVPTLIKVLRAEDVRVPLSTTHQLLCLAGHDLSKEARL